MKFAATVLGLSAILAPAVVLGDDRTKVRGDNPLFHCPGDISGDQVAIANVHLAPNPPAIGHDLVINASGTVKRDIKQGAKVHLTVKLGIITLIDKDEDLCDQVGHVDLECPIKEGTMNIVKTVSIPRPIPKGPFTVQANATTADGKLITCLQGTVLLQDNFFNIEL